MFRQTLRTNLGVRGSKLEFWSENGCFFQELSLLCAVKLAMASKRWPWRVVSVCQTRHGE